MNFNTKNGLPFPRVSHINLSYPTEGKPLLTYDQRMAIADSNGVVHFLDNAPQQCTIEIDLTKGNDAIQLINPETGENIPGAVSSLQELLLGLTAVIRMDQKAREQGEHNG
jgi:hypothetical protein